VKLAREKKKRKKKKKEKEVKRGEIKKLEAKKERRRERERRRSCEREKIALSYFLILVYKACLNRLTTTRLQGITPLLTCII
jgi:hypothetical protein